MKNIHIKNFLKCGYYNNFLINIISNYNCIILQELDYICLYYLKKIKCKSSTINYKKYSFSSCLSLENIICHGIPIKKKIKFNFLKIDIAINYKKMHSDSCLSKNYFLKKNYYFKFFFLKLFIFIKINKNFNFINNNLIKKKIFINEEYCSHGIFKKIHNSLIIFHCNTNNKKKIKNFDSFTVEPMFLFNDKSSIIYKNIVFSKKNNFSYQWEHTLYFINNKIIITTLRKNELCYI